MSEKTPGKRRTFSRDFKLKVLREVDAGKSQAPAAREYQLTETSIYKWRQQVQSQGLCRARPCLHRGSTG